MATPSRGCCPNTNPVTTGINAVPLIQLTATGSGSVGTGLTLTAGGSTVRGLVINNFLTAGIELETNGGNTIAGNFIGTDPTGTIGMPNTQGISFDDSPNSTIGGLNPGDRNLISGNNGEGIGDRNGGAHNWSGLIVQGNFIGTDVTGTKALSNSFGVSLRGQQSGLRPSVTVGGTAAGARNLISGNRAEGVRLDWTNGSVIQGNFIGADVAGTAKLGNNNAVALFDSTGCTVGGTAAGTGNVISGSRTGWGLTISDSTDNLVQGNFIGTDVTGTINLGNFSGGVAVSLVTTLTTNNTIGGTAANAGNTIAFNATGNVNPGQGVYVSLDPGNPVLGNSIFGNNGQGIRHSLSAAPTLSGATATTITGTHHGPANTTFRLEFFATPDTGQFFDDAQGKTFLGTTDVTTDASGVASFTFSPTGGVPSGQFLTATATDATGTSEFSHTIKLPAGSSALADLAVTVTADPNPVAAGGDLTFTITVTNTGPDAAQDVTLTAPVPAGTTFAASSSAFGWTITAPAVGSSGGAVTATTPTLAAGAPPVAFTFSVSVDGGAADDSTISESVSVASTTTSDPNSANNTAGTTTTVHVAAPARAVAGVTVSAAPNPVAPARCCPTRSPSPTTGQAPPRG